MRLAGEILILVALLFAVVAAFVHRGIVSELMVSGGSDPVVIARVMQLPFQAAIVSSLLGVIGAVLIAIPLLSAKPEPDAP